MLLQILKKDMMKRKGVNMILFLFITLSTVFLASSINNIMVISSAVDYYMDYAHVPDVNIIMNSKEDIHKINDWLDQKKDKGDIDDYQYNKILEISDKSVTMKKDGKTSAFDNKGASLFLSTDNVDYCKVFDTEGKNIHLQKGEIAISVNIQDKTNLQVGDYLIIHQNGIEKELMIKAIVKDAAYGSDMVGMIRFMLSQEDYNDYEKVSSQLGLYYINSDLGSKIADQMNNEGFQGIMNTITIDTYKLVYSFDMIMAGLLILIGVCLILIALLVLRFTLVFSLEEQYQEIGILKAIGLRNYAIKKIYLVKYLAIVIVGSTIGAFISVPVSQMMIESVNKNMIMASSELNIGINILCALFIIGLVLAFCYLCTRKLNKVSAITAIRGGYTGERFHNGRGISLSRFSHLPVSLYLGLNDITSHVTRYIVLIITFCISFILITIPLNTINTMNSSEMVRKFQLDPDTSVCVRKIEEGESEKYNNSKTLMEGVKRLQHEMKEKGYEAQMTALPIYFISYETKDSTTKNNIMSIQVLGKERSYAEYSEGKAPMLENEIAFSQTIMKENSWVIGDYVSATINGEKKDFVITGAYSDYMQLGKSARLNPLVNCEKEMMFDYWAIMVDLDIDKSQSEVAKMMQTEFPNYEWRTVQDMVNQNVGGIQDMLSQFLLPMTGLLCAVIMLITLLMEKLFITREKGEIAMMKSVGFRQATIRHWQLMRMIFVAFVSMIISIPLSLISNQYLLKPIFAIMGADVAIQVNPLQAYLIYPGILLIGIMVATAIATFGVKKINIREMNNLE
ncbi:ABC transporter permease [Candidatus Stoquefichus sp. SB1]|uniref:ABC transporter permease n=1 Tax=Candidatus Stoquefichus sp. SB1 TaxID=1658109 RepID=UPI00067EB349|nr:ABC transporter permease [Candidatus Stoquefichus sp. SB1]